MKKNQYIVYFTNGLCWSVYAFSRETAVILSQAKMIEDGNSYEVDHVEVRTNNDVWMTV